MHTLLFYSKISLIITFLFFNTLSKGQTCSRRNIQYMNTWYFGGNAGIHFNNNNINVLTNGKINQREGCASISDNQGNILFYTDGQTVYNRNHLVMPNGANLLGHASSTQSAIIIPKPGSISQFYIFTSGIMLDDKGIRYSIVDMTLNNGMGDIIATQKNNLLYSTLGGTVEKLSATYHSNNTDIWVIYHEFNTNSYRASLVTAKGINPAVITSIGVSIGKNWDAVGYMKLSPNSNLLATTLGGDSGAIQMLDFNNTTGALTNVRYIIMPPNFTFCYGLEFSPDGNLLYTSTLNGAALNSTGSIIQYNLRLNNTIQISTNPKFIAVSTSINYGALQLGPNGIIYSAKENTNGSGHNFLGTIQKPNQLGVLSTYTENAVNLNQKTSLIGLPSFLNPILDCSLPLKLLKFNIFSNNDLLVNNLTWEIENEFEIRSITIEKSENGIIFDSLISIYSKQKKHEYNDYINTFDNVYYRLKMIDLNGECTYSEIISTNRNQSTNICIYPNPFTDIISISLSDKTSDQINITVYDITGLIVHNEDIINSTAKYSINTTNWLNGIYLVKISNREKSFSNVINKK